MEYWNEPQKGVWRGKAHLRWEVEGIYIFKTVGTVGTVGILARILGEFGRFSRVPKCANGTLARGQESGARSQESG